MWDNSIRLWADYYSGRLDANVKATKLTMAYKCSTNDTQLKQYEFEKSAVEKLLHDLSVVQLKALTMHEKDKQSWQVISEKLGVKCGSLSYMKCELNKQLRKGLAEYGG